MKQRYLPFCLALAITFLTESVAAAEEFTPLIAFDQRLFPSFIISTASMKSEDQISLHETGRGDSGDTRVDDVPIAARK